MANVTVEENWLIGDHYKRKADALLREFAEGLDDLNHDVNRHLNFATISASFKRLKQRAFDFLFDYVNPKESDDFKQLEDFWFSTDPGLKSIHLASVHSQIHSHSAFLRILHKSIMKDETPIQGNRVSVNAAKILLSIYNRTKGNIKERVSFFDVLEECEIDAVEGQSLRLYMEQKGIIYGSSTEVGITTRGIDRIESEPVKMPETYTEKERRVLEKIRDMSGPRNLVGFEELVQQLGMSDAEVSTFCRGLDEHGLIEFQGGGIVRMASAGHHALESAGRIPRLAGDTYHLSIGTLHGAAHQGPGGVQNVNITNNPDFDQAIAGLFQLIQASHLPNDEIEELRDEVIKLNRLALSEPKPGLLEKAKARIDLMKISFEGAKILVHAAPYLHTAWEYFKAKYS